MLTIGNVRAGKSLGDIAGRQHDMLAKRSLREAQHMKLGLKAQLCKATLRCNVIHARDLIASMQSIFHIRCAY